MDQFNKKNMLWYIYLNGYFPGKIAIRIIISQITIAMVDAIMHATIDFIPTNSRLTVNKIVTS